MDNFHILDTLQLEQYIPTQAQLWERLAAVLEALAPSGGAVLRGGVRDAIAQQADALGIGARLVYDYHATGNIALSLGAEKPQADVLLVAHMDRPTYRVLSLIERTLYPICSNRFPNGEYITAARAVRFTDGVLRVSATGTLISHKDQDQALLRFQVQEGELDWQDSVLLHTAATLHPDGHILGTGLDNGLGVTVLLSLASILHTLEPQLQARGQSCLLVFTDLEEGVPDGFFGHGAARLRYVVPPPRLGFINIDGHNTGSPLLATLGKGASHAFVSGAGKGSLIPPNFQAYATDLAAWLNGKQPNSVQFNRGYLSRSDDMGLSQWSRPIALAGIPLADAHTGAEGAHLADIQACVRWTSYFLAGALWADAALSSRYGLL